MDNLLIKYNYTIYSLCRGWWDIKCTCLFLQDNHFKTDVQVVSCRRAAMTSQDCSSPMRELRMDFSVLSELPLIERYKNIPHRNLSGFPSLSSSLSNDSTHTHTLQTSPHHNLSVFPYSSSSTEPIPSVFRQYFKLLPIILKFTNAHRQLRSRTLINSCDGLTPSPLWATN